VDDRADALEVLQALGLDVRARQLLRKKAA
jgi:hypothetical protein